MFKLTCLLVTLLAVAAMTVAAPARAQFKGTRLAYYVSGDYTLRKSIGTLSVLVGKTPASEILPGAFTLTIAGGTPMKKGTAKAIAPGFVDSEITVFGKHRVLLKRGGSVLTVNATGSARVTVAGGGVNALRGDDSATVDIGSGFASRMNVSDTAQGLVRGGSVTHAHAFDTATITISGGTVKNLDAENNAIVTISGGSVTSVANFVGNAALRITSGTVANIFIGDTVTLRVSGGSVTNSILLRDNAARVDFVGTNLSFVYAGYGEKNPTPTQYACTVSGTFDGAARKYTVAVYSKESSTTGQITLNGVPIPPPSPVATPQK